jgi:hypothetical protein
MGLLAHVPPLDLSPGGVRGHGGVVREPRSSGRSWAVALLLATLTAATAVAAVGDGGGRTAGQQLESIRRRMETGLALFVGGKAPEAAVEFEAGYAEHPYSAFLFNAGVCYQKIGDKEKALERYKEYLRVDPAAPDIQKVQERIAALEAERSATAAAAAAASAAAGDGGATHPPPPPPPTTPSEQIPTTDEALRSLVVVETEPAGAPLRVFLADSDQTAPFKMGTPNAGWRQVTTTTSPTSLSLSVGRYHIVVEKFADFNVSETDIKVMSGHVHHFKANLSQGAFMSFLRVAANVRGAHIWIDDPKRTKAEWGTTPYGELVTAGTHEVQVEIPGFMPLTTQVTLEHGEQKELEVRLGRVDHGFIRVDADAAAASVKVDGAEKGTWKSGEAPLDVQLKSGKHRLEIEADGRKRYDGDVEVPKGQILPVHAKLIPKMPRGGAWTQAVLSGVLIGAGTFFGLESNKLYDQTKDDRAAGRLDADDDRVTRGRIYAIGADVGFVAGGVLAGLATYNFVRDPLPDSSVKNDKPVEFEDTLKDRPTAFVQKPTEQRLVRDNPRPPSPAKPLPVGPVPFAGGAGFAIGGTF